MSEADIIGALARGYCSKENEGKVLDSILIEAMVAEIGKLPQEPYLGYATTAELIDEVRVRIEMEGMLDYTTVGGEEFCEKRALNEVITQGEKQ